MLPSGEIITFHYSDPYDSIHYKGEDISFQLKGGECVMAKRLDVPGIVLQKAIDANKK